MRMGLHLLWFFWFEIYLIHNDGWRVGWADSGVGKGVDLVTQGRDCN